MEDGEGEGEDGEGGAGEGGEGGGGEEAEERRQRARFALRRLDKEMGMGVVEGFRREMGPWEGGRGAVDACGGWGLGDRRGWEGTLYLWFERW